MRNATELSFSAVLLIFCCQEAVCRTFSSGFSQHRCSMYKSASSFASFLASVYETWTKIVLHGELTMRHESFILSCFCFFSAVMIIDCIQMMKWTGCSCCCRSVTIIFASWQSYIHSLFTKVSAAFTTMCMIGQLLISSLLSTTCRPLAVTCSQLMMQHKSWLIYIVQDATMNVMLRRFMSSSLVLSDHWQLAIM